MTSDPTLLQIEVFATTEKNEKEFFDESQRRISFNTSELQFAIKELPDDRMTSKTICNTAIAVVFADESSSCSAARFLLVFLPLLLSTTISNSLIITSNQRLHLLSSSFCLSVPHHLPDTITVYIVVVLLLLLLIPGVGGSFLVFTC